MEKIKHLSVFYHERKVGTMALYKDSLAAFEYEQLFTEMAVIRESKKYLKLQKVLEWMKKGQKLLRRIFMNVYTKGLK